MVNLALLILRVTVGGLLTGHGAQKLFGWFGGHGLAGTAGWLESLDLRPGHQWALLAGLSEFGGGLLTVFGLLNPVGPLATIGAMSMAIAKAHPLNKPVWVTSGGGELPITNIAAASVVILAGPGRYSLDHALKIHLPRWLAVPGLVLVALGVAFGLLGAGSPQPATTESGVELRPE